MKFNAVIMSSALAAIVLAAPVEKFQEIKVPKELPSVSAKLYLPKSGLTFGDEPLKSPESEPLETLPELERRAAEALPSNVAHEQEQESDEVDTELLFARDEQSTSGTVYLEAAASDTFADEKSRSEAGESGEIGCLKNCEKNLCPPAHLTGVPCGHACNSYCK